MVGDILGLRKSKLAENRPNRQENARKRLNNQELRLDLGQEHEVSAMLDGRSA